MASGGPYSTQGGTVNETFCLIDGCYDFTINDSYGDGICCAYGNGSYNLVDGSNNTLASGGQFGASETTNFCFTAPPTCTDGVQNGNETGVDCGGPDCPPCNSGCNDTEVTLSLVLDNYPGETTWEITNSGGGVVASGGPYSTQGGTVNETYCLVDDCYDFTIFDAYGDGICCAYGNGSYSLEDDNNNTLASGGQFGASETTNFCLGGGSGPTCSDGIQNGNETGVDCGGPDCDPCSSGCSYQTINNHNFESGWGIWNDGGSDCRRSANDSAFANSGTYCVRIRDNTNSSVMTTDNLNLASYSEVTIDFTYIAAGMENGEDFWLQASTNGGASYQTLITWARGSEFVNNVREFESVVITGTFTSNTRFRFRCDASQNNDRIYIDDVFISGCSSSGTRDSDEAEELISLNENAYIQKIEDVNLYPNPARDILNVTINTKAEETIQLAIIDANGQLIQKQMILSTTGINNTPVDISLLESGIYMLQIISEKEQIVKKFSVLR
ncbi:MAG: T9SS type A sorting domain-containing protein [Saprospiraceae bacterium]|nr:T9SS type A sorting domain-containing protein [Saprospiraceae bacterium]